MTPQSSAEMGITRKRRFNLRRIALWLGAAILGLILLLGIFTQTGMFRNWLRGLIIETANESLKGELFIDGLDGNLFSNITLSDIAITLDSDTILSLGTVHARYGILELLGGTIQIDSVAIDSVNILLKQTQDSSWNLSDLMPLDTVVPVEEKTTAEPFGLTINLKDFVLSRVSAEISSINELIPRSLVDFGLHLSATYDTDRQQLQMHELHLVMEHPQLQVTDFHFKIAADESTIVLSDMVLNTVSNQIAASGTFHPEQPIKNTARIVAASISMSEFNAFLPEMASEFDGDLSLNASLDDDIIKMLLVASRSDQHLNFAASAGPVSSLLDSASEVVLQYSADLEMQGIILADWLHNPQLDALLNGRITLEGMGIESTEIEARLAGDLSESRIQENSMEDLAFDASYMKGDVVCSLSVNGVFGHALVSGEINNVLESPGYDFAIDLEQMDLRQVGLIDTLDTDINLHMEVTGSGSSIEEVAGDINVTIAPSRVMWLDVHQGEVLASFTGDGLELDTLLIKTSIAIVEAAGTVSRTEESLLNYDIQVSDTTVIAGILGEDAVRIEGRIGGMLSGALSNLRVDTDLDFEELLYSDIAFESALGNIFVNLEDSSLFARGQINISGLNSSGFRLDSLAVAGEYTADASTVKLAVWHQLAQAQTRARVVMDSLMVVVMEEFSIGYGDEHWSLGEETAKIIIDSTRYSVHNLNLISIGDSEQTIHVNGDIDFEREALLSVAVNNLKLEPLGQLAQQDLSGLFSAEVAFTSPVSLPEVTGRFGLIGGRVQQFDIHSFTGEFAFAEEVAKFFVNLKPTVSDSLIITGTVPVQLDTNGVNFADDRPLNISVVTDSLPLRILKAGDFVEAAGGFLDCDLAISQSLSNPTVSGTLVAYDVRVVVPEYGIEYNDIQARLSFLPNRIALDSVTMRRDKGTFRLSGNIDYDSSLIAGQIRSSRIDLVTDKFFIIRHRDYEVQLTSNIAVEGADTMAVYNGSITVDRSRFYLPALISETGEEPLDEMALPLLVVATAEETSDSVGSDLLVAEVSSDDSLMADLMSRLSGQMRLTIPKNTWIKSPELSLELAGDLKIVQEALEPEIFGDIRVVRGHYDLYGRRFKAQRGKVIFQGGSYLDPALDVEMLYILRTPSREKKELRLFVTGTAEVPVIVFTLDGVDIAEGDAVSYIIFGRSLDELNQSQQSSLSGDLDAGQMAGGIAAKMLAGQLAGALGNKLNMDVMEIKAGGNLESAAVVIGKYLTPDLFMSYQRSFGSSTDDDLEPEIVTLEYQLTKLIFLQLTEGDAEEAGFDVILKVEKD